MIEGVRPSNHSPMLFLVLPLAFFSLQLSSCSSVYYEALETAGIEKRQILMDPHRRHA